MDSGRLVSSAWWWVGGCRCIQRRLQQPSRSRLPSSERRLHQQGEEGDEQTGCNWIAGAQRCRGCEFEFATAEYPNLGFFKLASHCATMVELQPGTRHYDTMTQGTAMQPKAKTPGYKSVLISQASFDALQSIQKEEKPSRLSVADLADAAIALQLQGGTQDLAQKARELVIASMTKPISNP